MTLLPLFQNTPILRRPGLATFADIIKILTTFIKAIMQGMCHANYIFFGSSLGKV